MWTRANNLAVFQFFYSEKMVFLFLHLPPSRGIRAIRGTVRVVSPPPLPLFFSPQGVSVPMRFRRERPGPPFPPVVVFDGPLGEAREREKSTLGGFYHPTVPHSRTSCVAKQEKYVAPRCAACRYVIFPPPRPLPRGERRARDVFFPRPGRAKVAR